MSDREAKLRRFITDELLFGREVPFGPNDSFLEGGIIDSTGVLELVGFLEREFGVTVRDEELLPENLDSINRLVRFLDAKQA